MAQLVTMGGMLQCSFGVAPSSLVVLPTNMVNASKMPAATIKDNIPMANIMPFGMCITQSNPAVAAATAAALGTPTPAPCIPMTSSPWVPGSPKVLIKNTPALNNTSKCMCNWGGVISVTQPGQFVVTVP
jgi:hypothetical protein